MSLKRHNQQCLFVLHLTLPSALNLPFACSSTSHFLIVCNPPVCGSILPPNNKCVPHCCFTNTSFHSTTLLLNPILPNPLLPNPCCAPYTLLLGSTPVTYPPCRSPNPVHPLSLLLPLPLPYFGADRGRSSSTGPRVFAEWDRFGFLFGVCNDTVWAVLNIPPRGGVLRDRPGFQTRHGRQVSLAGMFSCFLCSDPG